MKESTGCLGGLFGLAFLALGAYFGIWVMLIGGIVNIVDAIKATPTDGLLIGIGIVKVIFFEMPIIVGAWLCLICCAAAGSD